MSADDLRAVLMRRLRPAAEWRADEPAGGSDFDLNADIGPLAEALRPAAVLIPLIIADGRVSVLLTRRADTLARHTGQIAFPGGRLDPGETAVQAALREAWEEVGLDPGAVEVLGLGDSYQTVTGYLITPVVGWIADAPVLHAGADEVAEIFEVPWDYLMDQGQHRREFMDPEEGPRRWFWALLWGERYIWGATAGIIRALSLRLGEAPVVAPRAVAR